MINIQIHTDFQQQTDLFSSILFSVLANLYRLLSNFIYLLMRLGLLHCLDLVNQILFHYRFKETMQKH
jgi:hypothetical protein